jgi:hypothetical protein
MQPSSCHCKSSSLALPLPLNTNSSTDLGQEISFRDIINVKSEDGHYRRIILLLVSTPIGQVNIKVAEQLLDKEVRTNTQLVRFYPLSTAHLLADFLICQCSLMLVEEGVHSLVAVQRHLCPMLLGDGPGQCL